MIGRSGSGDFLSESGVTGLTDAMVRAGVAAFDDTIVAEDAIARIWVAMTDASTIGVAAAAHPDDLAVDRFAAKMKAKLARAREKGRGGWDDPEQCSPEKLSAMLYEHVAKGDPIDVANFAMMIDYYSELMKK